MTRLGEYLPPDTNKDGVTDIADQQAEWRAQDQAESARAMRELTAAIGQGVRNLGSAFAGLWRNVTGLIMGVPKMIRRTHVRLVVQFIPPDVTESGELYERTFFSAPQNADHEHYRRTICLLAVVDRTEEQDLQFAQYLRGLKAYGEDPIRIWIERAWAKARAPSTKPIAEPAAIQSFAGLPSPVGLFTPVTQVLAVLLVLLGLWNFAQRAEIKAAKADAKENELRADAAEAANDGLAKRMVAAEEAMQQSQIVLADYERRIAERQRVDASVAAREAAIRRREKERADAIRNGGAVPDAEFLRELAEPAAVGDGPVSADPAASAAAGVQPEVHGDAGADAAQPHTGVER